MVEAHLDVASAYSAQSLASLKKIQDRVRYRILQIPIIFSTSLQTQMKFPQLENYVQCWPVTDLIRMRLKYTSARERRMKAFRVAEDIAEVASLTASKAPSLVKAIGKTKYVFLSSEYLRVLTLLAESRALRNEIVKFLYSYNLCSLRSNKSQLLR